MLDEDAFGAPVLSDVNITYAKFLGLTMDAVQPVEPVHCRCWCSETVAQTALLVQAKCSERADAPGVTI